MLYILSGVILAAGIIWLSRGQTRETPFIIGLFFLPGLYMAMGLFSDTPISTVSHELLWGIPYFVAGVIFLRFRSRSSASIKMSTVAGVVVGLLWIGHAAYDLFHDHLFINTGVPHWYPGLCVGFDSVFGCYVLYSLMASRPR